MTEFRTPYVPHFFKEQIAARIDNRLGGGAHCKPTFASVALRLQR